VGDNAPAGYTGSAHRVNEHTIEVTDKVKDKQIDTQRMEVSPDGKTLTSTVFIPNREKPQIQVFEPEKAPVRAESAAGGGPRLPSKLRATRALACSLTNCIRECRPFPLYFYKKCRNFSCRSEGGRVTSDHINLPQGTLDLLILRTLALGRQHGWAISERVQQMSSDVLRIQQGSLYPALHRLERRGLIKAHWGKSENNRRAKYYELSKNGRNQLEVETDAWAKLTAAVAQVLGTA
jgi:PadR family transcriptional regulator PadR